MRSGLIDAVTGCATSSASPSSTWTNTISSAIPLVQQIVRAYEDEKPRKKKE